MLFNALAARARLDWDADSRGIATDLGQNMGPIALCVLEALCLRGIEVSQDIRFPRQLREQDLARADLTIAMDEAEHRACLEERFRGWADRVVYWHIPDIGSASVDAALPAIEREIHSLMSRLSNWPQPSGSGCGGLNPRADEPRWE
jgi:protein-tyrosine phosphatase